MRPRGVLGQTFQLELRFVWRDNDLSFGYA